MAGSPCADAGDDTALPADLLDLDGDGDTQEPLPIDIDGDDRIIGGSVDMGSDEFVDIVTDPACETPGSGDFDDDGLWASDIALMVGALLNPTPETICIGDMNGDGELNGDDIQPFVEALLVP